MYKVISKSGLPLNSCDTLADAIAFAKSTGYFVTIKGPDFEACGIFGVDTIENGVCPDGEAYTWIKRRRR
jgi:hypothetical protein